MQIYHFILYILVPELLFWDQGHVASLLLVSYQRGRSHQRRRYLSVGFCGWKGSGAARKTPWMRSFLKNHLQLVFIRYVLAPRKRRRWRRGSASAAPDKASHSLVVFPLVIQMWGCLWAAGAEPGGDGESWGLPGHSGPHIPSPPLCDHQDSKECVQNPTQETACTSLKTAMASLSRASSLSFSLQCRDTDDIGMVIHGSVNPSNVIAEGINKKTLHLSSHYLTYYLKLDSKRDMDAFVSSLMELNVFVSDI